MWTCWFDTDHACDHFVSLSFPGCVWTGWFDTDNTSDHSVSFSFPACQWTCWFDTDYASDNSALLSHFQFVCDLVDSTLIGPLTILSLSLIQLVGRLVNLTLTTPHTFSLFQAVCEVVDLTLTTPLTIPCFQAVCELVDLTLTTPLTIMPLSLFQSVCELVHLTQTTPLTILSCFLIPSQYVNLLIWHRLHLWPFCLALSFPGCMWTCWFDTDHTSDYFVLLSHFQEVCELVALH